MLAYLLLTRSHLKDKCAPLRTKKIISLLDLSKTRSMPMCSLSFLTLVNITKLILDSGYRIACIELALTGL